MSLSGGHVAVVAFPFSSHAGQLLVWVRRLAAGSPETTFSFFGTRESNHFVFGDGDADIAHRVRAYDVWDGVPEGTVVAPERYQERIELFMTAAPEELLAGLKVAEREAGRKVTCLLTDAFFWFAPEIADRIGVSWVSFWTAGPATLSAHIQTDYIRNQVKAVSSCSAHLIGFVPGMSKVTVQDLPQGVVLGDLDSFFSQMLHKMGVALPRARAVFINSFEELDPTITRDLASKLTAFLSVGPALSLSAHDDDGCLAWLDKHGATDSVAYVSFGTVAVPPTEELVAIAQALEGSGIPFLWSLRGKARASLPEGFEEATKERGMVVGWAPQTQVLSHKAVGVFVTHCGWNSVLESIAGGVPMITRPFFGDHQLNGRMIDDVWEIGVRVGEGFTKEGLQICLGVALSQEKGKRMRENVKNLKELAKQAIAPTGSSTENFKLLQQIITKT